MVEIWWVEVRIATPSHRSKIIFTSGLVAAILNSSIQPTSGNVRSVINVSGIIEAVGVAVGIVSLAHCGKYLFPLPVFVVAILNSVDDRRREMSGNVDSAAILDLRLPVARNGNGSSTVGFLDLENRRWPLEFRSCAIELEICLGYVATPSVLRVSEIGSGISGLKSCKI